MTLLARLVALLLAFGQPAHAQFQPSDAFAPEGASGRAERSLVSAQHWMVAAANPLATGAGAEMLRAGGSAVDATIAVQLVLGLVEPQSSGLGGGAFALHWDAGKQRLSSFDGRETAPMAATPTLFQDAKGEPLRFMEAVIGGRSVGTPGTPRLLATLHALHGRLSWDRLFAPAIRLAEEGFAVSPRLAAAIAEDAGRLARDPALRAYFLDAEGRPLKAGAWLRNPAYAETLRTLARDGVAAFYAGPIADDIVRAVREAPGNPGLLALEDLATYRVKERDPVCSPYRIWVMCGMGPPSSGGLAVAQILGMLSHYDLAALGAASPEAWRLIGDASRLAFADRERYMADADFVPMPARGLIDPAYLAERAKLIAGPRALARAEPGNPKWSHASLFSDHDGIERPGTSHISVVDGDGNVVSMTTTIEAGFGARLMVRGFLLNNELTDFSFRSHRGGVPVANRVEPGKRPRSSMAPTIVLRDGRPVLAIGSPGGSQIIGYVAKALVAHLDWGMDVQAAISAPNMLNRAGPFELERGTAAEAMAGPLKALGFETRAVDLTSGIQAIAIGPDGLKGAADPRREGVAIGD